MAQEMALLALKSELSKMTIFSLGPIQSWLLNMVCVSFIVLGGLNPVICLLLWKGYDYRAPKIFTDMANLQIFIGFISTL